MTPLQVSNTSFQTTTPSTVLVSAYHLRPNSIIALIATNEPHPLQNSEQSLLAAIHSELKTVRNSLLPDLESVLLHPKNVSHHRRIGELLLQALLRLDALITEPTWEDARRQRKDAVREVQAMLDRLDHASSTP